ncbi:MAG: inositol monophosphatase [Thiofilum sp.]|uniref:inositol monophosphatase family protein n=1 Tax=Thiofilum sp. TaxID=2212733 RepID=UPI0025D877BD|nr:inositol monophosphatase [Thiofilum sp.]MBK8453169.1 inositol monophosphatase [Thiofilum sp.]
MLPDLVQVTQWVKHVAQQEIAPRFNKVGFSIKTDGSVVTEADLACHQALEHQLAQAYPHIAFLSEEMSTAQQQQLLETHEWLWVLDPLDGTSNFTAGMPLFCTSLALLHQGQVVQAVTYDVVRDEVFSAQSGQGAYLNNTRLKCSNSGLSLKQAVGIIDFKRLKPTLRTNLVNHMPFGSQRNLGTCALEWAWMAAGRGQVYLHGGMKLWDLAAGTLLLKEAGGMASTVEGQPISTAQVGSQSTLAASDPALFPIWQQVIADYSTGVVHG